MLINITTCSCLSMKEISSWMGPFVLHKCSLRRSFCDRVHWTCVILVSPSNQTTWKFKLCGKGKKASGRGGGMAKVWFTKGEGKEEATPFFSSASLAHLSLHFNSNGRAREQPLRKGEAMHQGKLQRQVKWTFEMDLMQKTIQVEPSAHLKLLHVSWL